MRGMAVKRTHHPPPKTYIATSACDYLGGAAWGTPPHPPTHRTRTPTPRSRCRRLTRLRDASSLCIGAAGPAARNMVAAACATAMGAAKPALLALALALLAGRSAALDVDAPGNSSTVFVPLAKACHPDCSSRGNCNFESGACECPWGHTGAGAWDGGPGAAWG